MATNLKNERKYIYLIITSLYYLFLGTQLFFNHTIISQFSMLIFVSAIFFLIILEQKIFFNIYFVFNILLIANSYLTIIRNYSINPNASRAMIITLLINLIVSFSVYNYIMIYNNLKQILLGFSCITLLFTFYIFVLSFNSIFIGRLGSQLHIMILGQAINYNSNSIALLSSFSFLIILCEYLQTNQSRLIPSLFWFTFIVLISGSRKGIFSLFFGALLLIYLINPTKIIKNIFLTVVSFFIFYSLLLNIPTLYKLIGVRIEALIDILFNDESDESSAVIRFLYIKRGWDYFLKRPWLGYGLDTFRYLSGSYGTYSHNNYIELLVAGGIPTLFFYYYYRFIILIRLANFNKNKFLVLLFVLLGLLFILEYGFVDYYERIYVIIFIYILTGINLLKHSTYNTEMSENVKSKQL